MLVRPQVGGFACTVVGEDDVDGVGVEVAEVVVEAVPAIKVTLASAVEEGRTVKEAVQAVGCENVNEDLFLLLAEEPTPPPTLLVVLAKLPTIGAEIREPAICVCKLAEEAENTAVLAFKGISANLIRTRTISGVVEEEVETAAAADDPVAAVAAVDECSCLAVLLLLLLALRREGLMLRRLTSDGTFTNCPNVIKFVTERESE
uniref:Uncharacterized protein n=1 Tax=Glossina pallidipes TaxID=7398 RepID=A0A1B0A276_GLOPL